MSLAADYRRYAAECLALSARVSDVNDRDRLIQMAQAFLEIANKQERTFGERITKLIDAEAFEKALGGK